MIQRLRIKNFAIIEDIDIEFHDGLHIVTGETGAGKSIVIEAMSLALGSRADTSFVRTGQEKALVQMIADLGGQEYVITREVSSNGRNLCKINGEIVPLSQLSSLCRKLADIHGQYDHQSLLDPSEHIHLLDIYGSDTLADAKSQTAEAFHRYSDVRSRLTSLRNRRAEMQRQHDFHVFELEELTSADLKAGEDETLSEEITRLQHSEQIFEDLAAAYEITEESEYAVLPALKQAAERLGSASRWNPETDDLYKRINDLYYELEDISSEVRRSRDSMTFSPEELDLAIDRLNMLNRLKEKHNKTIPQLIEYRTYLEDLINESEDSKHDEEKLTAELVVATDELKAKCENLSQLRKDAALRFEKDISSELEQLNFNQSSFKVSFERSDSPDQDGWDIVEFLISTNPGEDLKPLARIASGGEMSRIMLAFKKITGDYDRIPTMIFDEIDSGISGITASIVGRKLREISESHQIICITHLPQIAACGDHHYSITKDTDDQMTYTVVTELTEEERVVELARLLGGTDVTEITLRSARELLKASY